MVICSVMREQPWLWQERLAVLACTQCSLTLFLGAGRPQAEGQHIQQAVRV
jgi:hypothetical protein